MVDWVQLLQTFGLAVVVLFAVGVALWKAAGWVGREIIIPIRDRIIARVLGVADKLETTLDKVSQDIDLMLKLQGKQTGLTQKQALKVQEAACAMMEAADAAKKIVNGHGDNTPAATP